MHQPQSVMHEYEAEPTAEWPTDGRWKQEGFERGLEEGFKEGWAAALLRLLERRFGTVPEAVLERMEEASVAAFQRWFVRALDAVSFDDVFGS